MNTYKITMTVDRNQLLRFIDTVGLDQNIKVEALPDPMYQNTDIPKPRAPRGRRSGSRVNNIVLGALAQGPQPIKQLKSALESAGMAPGSLSTALATLQRSGDVHRTSEGIYELTAKAAE